MQEVGERAPAFSIGGPGPRAIPVRNRVLAAPMCGASKPPYRRMARRFGADVVYTEMVKAKPLARSDPKTLALLAVGPDEDPVGPQICGADPAELAAAARCLEQLGFPLVDINMGCPVKKVVRSGAGAALLRDPHKVEAVIAACVAAVDLPVTVKLRSGWDHQGHATAALLARAAEAGGAALITIHARPRSQRHDGAVDVAALAAAKAAVGVPVVANGGITTGAEAAQLLRESGCDAVMIGRGAHGRPWLFRDAARAIAGLPALPAPTGAAYCDLIEEHFEGMVDLLGDHGVKVFRKYAGWYFRDAPEAEAFRKRAVRLREPAAFRELLLEWREANCAA